MDKFASTVSKDSRFQHILTDPRFKRVPKHERKIRIDSRFKGMFTDKKFKTKYVVDKRGRKVNETSSENLSKYYELSDQEAVEGEEKDGKKKSKKERRQCEEDHLENDEDSDLSEDDLDDRKDKCGVEEDKSQEEVELEENLSVGSGEEEGSLRRNLSDDDESTDSEDSSDTDVDLPFKPDEPPIVHDWGELSKDCPVSDSVSRRLAACNMDWDRVSAQDLYVLFSSFKPQGGVVESVSVYPSDLGLQQMEKEEVHGPKLPKLPSPQGDLGEEEKLSIEALRQYQLERLKYFYAVIICDSPATAEHIYEQCDGIEYEMSATRIDLRFIPDNMTFDDRKPSSTASDSAHLVGYTPAQFVNTALQQSAVRLTWDETDRRRLSTTMKRYTREEAMSADLRDYLASSSDSGSEIENGNGNQDCFTEEDKLEKYKSLVAGDRDADKDNTIDMEISWDPGLKEIGRKIESKKASSSETAWEEYLEERKKKKKMKKSEKKGTVKESTEDDSCSKEAELELVMMDSDEDGKEHFSLKGILQQEKENKKKKRKRLREDKMKKKSGDNFLIDLDDTRFTAIYESSQYAVDPSHPQYKPTKSMAALVTERQRRLQKKQAEEEEAEGKKEGEGKKKGEGKTGGSGERSEAKRIKVSQSLELQQLVKSVKSKTKTKMKKKKMVV